MTYIPMFGIFNLSFLIALPVIALMLALFAFWIWMLVDCAKRISAGDTKLVGWLIAIALVHIFGAIAYYLFGRPPSRPV